MAAYKTTERPRGEQEEEHGEDGGRADGNHG